MPCTSSPRRQFNRPRKFVIFGLLSLVAVVAVVAASSGLVVAAHPPLSICGVCDSVDGATDPGTLDVHVDEDGDSRWVARVPVNESTAERYGSDSAALEAAVDDGWYRHDVAIDDARNIESSIDDGVVTVEYDVPEVADSAVGDGRVLDYFYAGGTQYRYDVRAERVTIHLPEEMQVANDPPNADQEDGSLTWTADDGFSSRTYVAYGPDGIAGSLASWASVGVVFGPLLLSHGVVAGLVPAATIGVAAIVVGRFDRQSTRRRAIGERGENVLERVCSRSGLPLERRTLLGIVVGMSILLGVGGWLLFGTGPAILLGTFGVAGTSFLLLGHGLESGSSTWPVGLLAVTVPFVATTAFAPYYVLGFGPLVAGLLFVPWAVGACLGGYVLSLVGRRVGRTVAQHDT
ncbi:cation:proton antiporter [Natronobacterium texcoconense]|uniref:Uncharacterized protein n=1 Tax=Natronobacterium texcoconense TaxID=1095778 RepID=A0A1H1BET9_NATTX|nr:hypothetical protein [Natronobacterium texcoconense]SDQ50495.1 hypothetical protein SAMN04489842_1024 [Natronobacterium texcoconense]